MADTHETTHTSTASITLRGKTVSFRPLTLTHVAMAYDDLLVIRSSTDVLAPDVFPHFLRVLAVSIKDQFPDVPLPALMDDLADTLNQMDLLAIAPAVFNQANFTPYLQKEPAHGIH